MEQRRLGCNCVHARTIGAAAAVGFLTAAAGLMGQLSRPQTARATLPDGSQVVLRGATFGTHHTYEPANPLVRWANDLGPFFGVPDQEVMDLRDVHTGKDLPPHGVAWLSIRGGSWQSPAEKSRGIRTVWVDEHGCTYPGGALRWGNARVPPAEQVASVVLPAEATGGKRWKLRGYQLGDNRKVLFELPIRSPFRSAVAPKPCPLTPHKVPQEFATRRLVATLASLEHQERGLTGCSTVLIAAREKSNPKFRWSPIAVSLEDRWGRVGEARSGVAYGESRWGFRTPSLCANEPAWKIKAELAPDPWSGKPPDYDWGRFRLSVRPRAERSSDRGRVAKSRGVNVWIQTNPSPVRESKRGPENLKELSVVVGIFGNKAPVRMAIKSVNGERYSTALRRSKMAASVAGQPTGLVDFSAEPNGELGQLYVPNPDVATELDLELVGYAGRDKVEFVVNPNASVLNPNS